MYCFDVAELDSSPLLHLDSCHHLVRCTVVCCACVVVYSHVFVVVLCVVPMCGAQAAYNMANTSHQLSNKMPDTALQSWSLGLLGYLEQENGTQSYWGQLDTLKHHMMAGMCGVCVHVCMYQRV